ncbi:MAG: hypothetical protein ACPG5T_01695 [Endozoicomonas sp.]
MLFTPMKYSTEQEVINNIKGELSDLLGNQFAIFEQNIQIAIEKKDNALEIKPANLWTLCALNGFFPFDEIPDGGIIKDPNTGFEFHFTDPDLFSIVTPESMEIFDEDEIEVKHLDGSINYTTTVGAVKKRFQDVPEDVNALFFDLLKWEGCAENSHARYKLKKHPGSCE